MSTPQIHCLSPNDADLDRHSHLHRVQSFMKSDPQNLRGALFSENESGYLMGVAAALATKTNGVSAVGGP